MGSIASPKVITMEGKRVGAHSLVHSTSSGMRIMKIDKQVHYSHGLAQTKPQVG
jgi:hypothetical protein